MESKSTVSGRILVVIGLVLAGLCLVRVLTVAARADDDVEVYSSMESKSDDGDSDRSTDESRAEIRLSRPDDAESRVVYDQGYDQVPGAYRLQGTERPENAILVPGKQNRKIAGGEQPPAPSTQQNSAEAPAGEQNAAGAQHSTVATSQGTAANSKAATTQSSTPPASPSPVPVREALNAAAASAQPTAGKLTAEAIEPKPFTSADATERASETRAESINASNTQLAAGHYGLKSEPAPDTNIEPPVPQSATRNGVQEVSLIVSDYGYFPSRIFVTQNVPVKIYMSTPSKVTMCFMLDAWGLKKGVSPGRVEEVTFTPEQSGEYRFYCPVRSIEGKITVRESPTAAQSARGLAAEYPADDTAGRGNAPKNSQELRQLIED